MSGRPEYADIAQRIEQELRQLGAWEQVRPPEEELQVTSAFGSATMPFTRWLQFVLLERLLAVARGEQEPPTSSSVGVYAVRELDGWHEADGLVSVLSDLDGVVVRSSPAWREGMTEDEELQLLLDLDAERERERGD